MICGRSWEVVFNPANSYDLTPEQDYDKKLNIAACMMIRKGLSVSERQPYLCQLCHASMGYFCVDKTGMSTLQLSRYECEE